VTGRVRLSEGALATIAREAPASSDGRETGGILLGFDAQLPMEALVMEAGDPGPRAERRSDFFRRDVEHAQRLADEAFARTTSRWIGEWHTHPQPEAPSRTDHGAMRAMTRRNNYAVAMVVAALLPDDTVQFYALLSLPDTWPHRLGGNHVPGPVAHT